MTPRRRVRPAEPQRQETDPAELVFGVHPVLELIELRPASVERLFVARDGGARTGRILRRAREAGVPVTHLPRPLLARKLGRRAGHQGVAARVSPIDYADVEAICAAAARASCGLLVVVDGVEDPGNLGAIVRSAAAAGAHGLILGAERTVGLTPVVAKTSAGAVERLPIGRETKLPRRLAGLRERGFSIVALDPGGGVAWDEPDLAGPLVLVLGGEGRGIRPSIRRACNITVAIPLAAGVESLNVAVAAGVLLFEALRQRRGGAGP